MESSKLPREKKTLAPAASSFITSSARRIEKSSSECMEEKPPCNRNASRFSGYSNSISFLTGCNGYDSATEPQESLCELD